MVYGVKICIGDVHHKHTPSFIKIRGVALQFLIDLIWNDPTACSAFHSSTAGNFIAFESYVIASYIQSYGKAQCTTHLSYIIIIYRKGHEISFSN